jgi:N-acetylmuramoyl-L-alanine amidase-like protein
VVRRQIAALTAGAALIFAGPAAAHASATLAARDLPAAGRAAARFELLGLHWQGSGRVRFRTRTIGGRWTSWRRADVDERADAGSPEATPARGWQFGEPYWVGPSDRVEWKAVGRVGRVRAFFVRSPAQAVPPRALDVAGSPRIIMRPAWNADETIRRSAPRYASAVHFAVVHHTAGTNAYSAEESASIVRGIELYHVKGNGWNDIGYNFLVDRYGNVFEGRYGGVARNVVGAHAAGFNTGSVGVAVLGTYGAQQITPAARAALVRLLAWRLDVAHVDPLSTLIWTSGGNSKYPTGTTVALRAITGHRDTGFTECPGAAFYAQLPAVAAAVAQTGLPKLYDPIVRGRLGAPVTFSARLSSPQAWTVSVRNSAGVPVASGSGTGAAVRWIWNSSGAQGRSYSWAIEAPSTRVAKGTFGGSAPEPPPQPLPPVLTEFAVAPTTISPDGDGHADAATVTYRLRRSALVTARVLGEGDVPAVTLFQDQRQSARLQSWSWAADAVPDGRYILEVSARGGDGKIVRATAAVLVDRTLGFVSAQPPVFSPNGDGRLDTITFSFDLGAPATVAVRVVQYSREVALVFGGDLQPGPQQIVWDGTTSNGVVPDGQYDLVVTALDALGSTSQMARFTVDSRAQ